MTAKQVNKIEERKYEIVTGSSIKAIIKEVNKLIDNGYKPLGGIVVAEGNQRAGNQTNEQLFIQTLYKE